MRNPPATVVTLPDDLAGTLALFVPGEVDEEVVPELNDEDALPPPGAPSVAQYDEHVSAQYASAP